MAEDLNFLMSGAETTEVGRQFQVLTVLGNKLLFLSSLALTDETKNKHDFIQSTYACSPCSALVKSASSLCSRKLTLFSTSFP